MTADAYRAAIARLELSQLQAGTFLGIGGRTSRRFAAEGAPPSVALALHFAGMLMDAGLSRAELMTAASFARATI